MVFNFNLREAIGTPEFIYFLNNWF